MIAYKPVRMELDISNLFKYFHSFFNHCHFVKGTESYYNDNAVANVLNQVHEVSILKCALKCLINTIILS